MRRRLGRLVGIVVRSILFVLVLSVVLAGAVSMGVVDLGPVADRTIDPPEPQPTSIDEAAGNDPSRDPPGTTRLDTGQGTISSTEIEARIHERINAIRTENTLSTLDHDGTIARIARTHSDDMADREYFSHVNPDGEGPADRFGNLYPSKCRAVGENLALVELPGATGADEIAERIVTGWMNSEGHRKNILTGQWDTHGIGVYIDAGRVYATQNFCDEW